MSQGSGDAVITKAAVVGGHDGRAEIEVELTYPNGGTATIALDEDAVLASLDFAAIASLEELIGQPWSVVLPAITQLGERHARSRHP